MTGRPNETIDSATHRSRLPLGIWALGLGSLFMDSSSELIHSLMPVFLVGVLGASVATVGVIEGIAEATASITKVFSGTLSDWLRRRKPLVIVGYGLAAITKPLFPLASSAHWVFAARFLDRIGKGIRGAPRDALIADIVPPALRGAAYGLRQALDSVGAVLGPLLAVVFMLVFANDVRATLWVAIVPAVLAVAVLWAFVREPETAAEAGPGPVPRPGSEDGLARNLQPDAGGNAGLSERGAQRAVGPPLRFADAKRLPPQFWIVITLGAVLALARFSEAFLVLRAEDLGVAVAFVPVVMIVMNVVYSGAAYPAGRAADRMSARTLLLLGLGALITADVLLAFATSALIAFVGAGIWGLHMALTQGLLSKLVADTAPADLRGSAFGLFNLVNGVAALGASVVAGALWSRYGPEATFLASAAFALIAVIGFLLRRST